MEFSTSGTSDMTPAMEQALKLQRADLVWFVTDGDMPNNHEFLNSVRTLNRAQRARINAIAATSGPVTEDETSTTFVRFLGQLTSEHGGKCYDLEGTAVDTASLPPLSPPTRTVGTPRPQQSARVVGGNQQQSPPARRGGKQPRPPGFDPAKIPTGPSIFQED